MLVKINDKPIEVTEDSGDKAISVPYLITSLTGFGFILWIMDYVSFVFLHSHPFPFIQKVVEVIAWFF